MPSTRFERLFAAVGLVAVCALAILTVSAWADYAKRKPDQAPRPVAFDATTSATPTVATAVDDRVGTSREDARAPTAPAPPQGTSMHLRLMAVRGDCWVAVRLGGAAGKLVYAGILAQAQSRSFTAKRLWIELGAPHTLDALLNGKPVTNLPRNTATVTATREGVEPAFASEP